MEEYRRHIEKDAALERRFQPITVEEPTEEETVEILKGIRENFEKHHQVEITDVPWRQPSGFPSVISASVFCRIRPSM